MKWLTISMVLIAGAFLPIQVGINTTLAKHSGNSPVWAALVSFIVGTIALFVYFTLFGPSWPTRNELASAPWWAWLGGFVGAFYVAVSVMAAPRIGVALMVGLVVAAQMFTSLALDHYGLLGFEKHPINPWRMFGVGLIIAGVVLLKKF